MLLRHMIFMIALLLVSPVVHADDKNQQVNEITASMVLVDYVQGKKAANGTSVFGIILTLHNVPDNVTGLMIDKATITMPSQTLDPFATDQSYELRYVRPGLQIKSVSQTQGSESYFIGPLVIGGRHGDIVQGLIGIPDRASVVNAYFKLYKNDGQKKSVIDGTVVVASEALFLKEHN